MLPRFVSAGPLGLERGMDWKGENCEGIGKGWQMMQRNGGPFIVLYSREGGLWNVLPGAGAG